MRKIINLPFISRLKANLASQENLIQVLLGPRQVGKTTSVLCFLEESFKDKFHYVSVDSVLNASPEWLREQWQHAHEQKALLVIDEIQKCYNWSETIKALWDADKRRGQRIRCVLLGSSSMQIQKGLSESLTGRFQMIQAFHWNADESRRGYNVDREDYLRYGGYPGSYHFIGSEEWQKYVTTSIISTVLEKDILQFHHVRNPALFKQAFAVLIGYPAMEVSYTKLLGQLQEKGNVEVVKHYLELYEGAFLIKVLGKFSGSLIRTKSSSPKILPLAPCLYYLGILDQYTPEERGRAFEAIVGSQLVRTEAELFYWRQGKFEVDYVVKRGRKIWAIEVKSGRKKSSKGLEEFIKLYPQARGVFITPENYQDFEHNPMGFLERL
jgi:uncharacterized protein